MFTRRAVLGAAIITFALSAGAATAAEPRPVPARVIPLGPDLPGLGQAMLGRIPAATRQALVITGDGPTASTATAVLYERGEAGWTAGAAWPARNGHRGWSDMHYAGDLRTPIGVFDLTDAGGLMPDPGTRLPYDRSDGFTIGGTGLEGEPLAGSFDYVVAVNYNRVPGRSPLDPERPGGAERGGGIWIHVDHQGSTHGCVTLTPDRMRSLLRTLDPAARPVVVMGDAATLAR